MYVYPKKLVCYHNIFIFRQVRVIEHKGRGVFAGKEYDQYDFVVEYRGKLLTSLDEYEAAKARNTTNKMEIPGMYIYEFDIGKNTFWSVVEFSPVELEERAKRVP